MTPRVLILLFIVASPAFGQASFSDSSRLGDRVYVEKKIREISDSGLWSAIDLRSPGLTGVRKTVERGRWDDAARIWGEVWRKRQPQYVTDMDHLLIDSDLLTHPDSLCRRLARSSDERDTVFARADRILRNKINVWGSTIVDFEEGVDFDRDIGQSAKYGFHYWIWARPLLAAHMLTGGPDYLAQFERLFNRWYDQRNSITSGFPMLDIVYYELGLSIRCRTFLEFLLLPSPSRRPSTESRLLKTFLAAGRWLYQLERWEGYRPGNWQIHGSYTLVQLALAFPEFRESRAWMEVGMRRLTEHLERDFFGDGGHSERSPRNYTLSTYLNYRNLDYLLRAYAKQPAMQAQIGGLLTRVVEWWIALMTPTGEMPGINDSHRGLFPPMVMRDAVQVAGVPYAGTILRDLLGDTSATVGPLPPFTSRHLPASGFTVMRSDWTPDALYMLINHGPFAGFHSHFDVLDLEIYGNGLPLAVDAGVGRTYDDPLYLTWYRSSRAHNMVVVNDSDALHEVGGEKIRWGSTPELDYFTGEHRGYARFGVTAKRTVIFVRSAYWLVLDRVTCTRDGDTLSWYCHLPGGAAERGAGFVSGGDRGMLILPAENSLRRRSGIGWGAATRSRIAGETEEIPWVRFDQSGSKATPAEFTVLLAPFRGGAGEWSVERPEPWQVVVRSPAWRDTILLPRGEEMPVLRRDRVD